MAARPSEHDQPSPDDSTGRSVDCAVVDEMIREFLDGRVDSFPRELPHLGLCEECRTSVHAAKLLRETVDNLKQSAPPPNFTDRIVTEAIADFRTRRRRQIVARSGAALVAASLIAFAIFRPWRDAGPGSPELAHETAPSPAIVSETIQPPRRFDPTVATRKSEPPRVKEKLAEAQEALASLTDEAGAATRDFFPSPGAFFSPPSKSFLPQAAPISTASLTEATKAAESGIEPMANTTRRALNLFRRDLAIVKPNKQSKPR